MIERLEVGGFRLLDGFVADLSHLTVVIGGNACGKSTLIGVLQFVRDLLEFPLQDVIRYHGGVYSLPSAVDQQPRISWKLTFQKPAGESLWARIPVPGDTSFVYEVVLSFDEQGQARPEREILAFSKPKEGHPEPLKLLESRRDRSMIYDFRRKQLVPFDAAGPPPDSSSVGDGIVTDSAQVPEQLARASEQGAMLRLGLMRFHSDYPQASWIRSMLASASFYPGFSVGRSSKIRTEAADIRPVTTLSPEGDNLGSVLLEMFSRYQFISIAEEFRAFVRAAYPFVDMITAETTYGQPPKILVRVKEKGMRRAMELWDLSDGMLRFLCLAAALLNPVPPPFIAIDEPELGLHPRMLPIVADIIKSAAERSQVLITTHSPELLNCFEIDQIAVMRRDDSRAVWARPGERESLKRMLAPLSLITIPDLHRSGELEEDA